jgi:hypothetical protein
MMSFFLNSFDKYLSFIVYMYFFFLATAFEFHLQIATLPVLRKIIDLLHDRYVIRDDPRQLINQQNTTIIDIIMFTESSKN